jgi:hypothetical protein
VSSSPEDNDGEKSDGDGENESAIEPLTSNHSTHVSRAIVVEEQVDITLLESCSGPKYEILPCLPSRLTLLSRGSLSTSAFSAHFD